MEYKGLEYPILFYAGGGEGLSQENTRKTPEETGEVVQDSTQEEDVMKDDSFEEVVSIVNNAPMLTLDLNKTPEENGESDRAAAKRATHALTDLAKTVEEEILMHKMYDVMSAHGLTKKELEFIHKSSSTTQCLLNHSLPSHCHKLLPLPHSLHSYLRLKDKLEEFFNCQYELFVIHRSNQLEQRCKHWDVLMYTVDQRNIHSVDESSFLYSWPRLRKLSDLESLRSH
ncbi:hypothetical protein Ahy_B08g090055 [Arachis hypogaea]|uniref:Uncharacterized protein n=1 Tax=Arachis hypogaea TaxID=3818 RepID=A0A444XZF1_ARAHY|nr:hypothetical protein Ahy_B08g090055 [Arachis hypogaea]